MLVDLQLDGRPLFHVTLQIGGATARTDHTGPFPVTPTLSGHQELLVDARTANQPGRTYGVFEIGVDLKPGQTTILPFTSWMPRIDTAHAVSVSVPTAGEIVGT